MQSQKSRIEEILAAMQGPERGKKTRLADIAGCTKALIGQWMGEKKPAIRYDHARNIERMLGWRVDWIIHGTTPKQTSDEAPIELALPESALGDSNAKEKALIRQAIELATDHPTSMLANLIVDFNRLNMTNKKIVIDSIDEMLRLQRRGPGA